MAKIKGNIWMVSVFLLISIGSPQISAAPPQTLNYQGYLTNTAGTPLNGTYSMVFGLYGVASGGVALWTETQSVTVANGLYNVILGSVTPIALAFDVQYYLGIKIGADTEMTPRGTLTSSPYAFRSVTVQTDPTPAGALIGFAGATAPAGYKLCDGSAVSRTTYATLFAVIGITYGAGDGTTTFNLPDMRGVFPRGAGINGTLTKANATPMTGGAIGLLSNDKMQGHKHNTQDIQSEIALFGVTPLQSAVNGTNGGTYLNSLKTSIPITDGTNSTPRTGDETAPASLSVNFIIKY